LDLLSGMDPDERVREERDDNSGLKAGVASGDPRTVQSKGAGGTTSPAEGRVVKQAMFPCGRNSVFPDFHHRPRNFYREDRAST